jgi:hypothetical protein
MSTPTFGNLMTALRNADAAGDTEAAQRIAAMIRAQNNPTSGMSTGEKLAAGIGQGMTDAYTGATQLGTHLARFLNPSISPEIQKIEEAKADQEAKDKAKIDKPLLDTGAGHVGNWLGNIAATLPFAGIGSGEAAAAKFMPMLAKAAQVGAVQGGLAGAVQPVTGDDFASGKTGQVATGALLGGGLNAIGAGGLAALKNVAGNAVGTTLNTLNKAANKSEFAQQGEQLAARTGIDLTPAQISGGKAQTQLENLARQSIFSRNQAFAADQKIAQQWTDYVNRTLDGISQGGGSPADIGQRVQGVVKNAVQDLTSQRNAAAAQDYGKIRGLLKGQPAVMPTNYMETLNNLSQEYASGALPGGSDYAKLANAIGDMQQKGLQNADLGTLMQTRRYLSQVAGGQVKLAGDVGIGPQKRIATQLLGAIDQDLDASAQKIGGPIGDMLQQANARYRQASQQIEGLQNSALGKLVGQDFTEALGNGTFNKIPGEVVMQRMQAMTPSQIAATKGIMQANDPEAWQAVKRSVLEDALNKAKAAAPSDGANPVVARPGAFVKALSDNQKLNAMFDPGEFSEIGDAVNAAKRIADKTGTNFSGTATAAEGFGLMKSIGGLLMGNVAPAAGMATQAMGMRSVASIMANSEGRAVIRQMAALPAGSNRFRELAAKLAAIAASREVGQQ